MGRGDTLMAHALHPRVTAHRGWLENYAENTLDALREARDEGCRWVEFDVRRSADNGWLVNHDVDLGRVFGVPLTIADCTAEKLRRSAPIPLLEEALDLFREDCAPIVEIKEHTTDGVEILAELLSRYLDRYPLHVVARGAEMPAALHRALPELPILYYTRDWDEALQKPESWLAGFDLPGDGIDQPAVAQALRELRDRKRKLAIWTIDDLDKGRFWLDAGADWLITNSPWLFGA